MTVPALATPQHDHAVKGIFQIPRKFLGGHGSPNLYILEASGDCCRPDIRSADRVIVSPDTVASGGDYVILWPRDGTPLLKRLTISLPPPGWKVHPEDEIVPQVICEQTNPPRQFIIAIDRIRA